MIGIIAIGIAITSCGRSPAESQELTIATAANVQFAMEEIIQAFSQDHGIPCEMIVGSSGKLTAQIVQGAPYDVFVSADMKYPQNLLGNNKTWDTPVAYAYGKLVLWTLDEDLTPELDQLKEPEVKHIAIANPRNAPYGVAAMQVLQAQNLAE